MACHFIEQMSTGKKTEEKKKWMSSNTDPIDNRKGKHESELTLGWTHEASELV